MRQYFLALLLATLSTAGLLAVQEESAAPAEAAPMTEEEIQAARARVEAELAAWETLTKTTVPEEVLRLSQDFLATFPGSELTPYVHKSMALAYQELNDYENLVLYFQKTLEALPRDPDVRPFLAVAFAERGENNMAIDYGEEGLAVLETAEKLPDVPIAAWTAQKDRAKADAQYAIGLALLKRAGNDEAVLRRSAEHLEEATQLDPAYHRAYFRLGAAYTRLNEADKAIESFARTVATGGVAADIALEQLQQIYEILNKDTSEIQPTIEEQRQQIASRVAEKDAMLQQLEMEEAQQLQQEQEQELQGQELQEEESYDSCM